jgi:outer membrane receptor protein involved in Fe transport
VRQLRANTYPSFGILAAAIATALSSAQPTFAQETQPEEITVTGSRIVRRDFEASSPITTVESSRFEESSTIAIESVVNQLPQFVPAASQFEPDGDGTGGYLAGSTRTPGASTVSLRGLGSNRNLVLLDGRRAMPVNATGAVNTNNIPAAALERVETITGGASSVYGADAIAGVVNFVLKKDFEGLQLDAQYGGTDAGGAEESRVSALFGSNVLDDRGNIMIGFEMSKREPLLKEDREFFRRGFADRSVNGDQVGTLTASGINIAPTNPANIAVVNSIFNNQPAGAVPVTNNGVFFMNDDGSVYRSAAAGHYRYNGLLEDSDGTVWRKLNRDNALQQNQPFIVAQLPLERYSMFARAHMDLTDNIRIFGQGMVTDTTSETYGPFTLHIGGWGATVPHGDQVYAPSVGPGGNTLAPYLAGGLYGLNCPTTGGCTKSQAFPKPLEVQQLLDSRPNREAPIGIVHVPNYLGPKTLSNDVTSIQLITGLEGEFTERDWTWELYTSRGTTRSQVQTAGTTRLEGFRWLVNQPNYGRGLQYTGNPAGSGFGAGTVYCTSGLPIFYGVNGWTEAAFPFLDPTQGAPTQDCMTTLIANVKDNGEMTQNVTEFNLQGGLLEMPAGDLRFAVGVSHRENSYEYVPDSLVAHSAILDSAAGIYPANKSFGEISASDIYGELLIPLLADKPGVQSMNLEIGYRHSDNDPSESVDTYKAIIDWRITDRVRFRGGKQRANRAPNIAELFQSSEQEYDLAGLGGDYCSTRNPLNPLSANPARNPNAAAVQALCSSLMGPDAAGVYYSDPLNQAETVTQQRWLNVVGNPNLTSEQGDTLTAGFVADIGDSIQLSVDYWHIEISDLISAENVRGALEECFNPITNPGLLSTYSACTIIRRDPVTGGQSPYFVTYHNQSAIDTAGIDLQVDWSGDVGPGTLSVNFLASILDKMVTKTAENDPGTDWKGSSGPGNLSGVQNFAFDYRTFTSLGYAMGDWNMNLRWRHLPSIKHLQQVTIPTAPFVPTDAYDMFDFSGRYTFSEKVSLRFGVDNVFDKQPERTFEDNLTSAYGNTNAGFYDILGRRYYLGVNFGF